MSNSDSPTEFFSKNLSNVPSLLNELKQTMEDSNSPIKSENLFLLINILKDIIRKQELLQIYLQPVVNESNNQEVVEVQNKIIAFLSEEKDNLIHYLKELNKRKKNNMPYLVKMEYKFIGLSSCHGLDKGVITPKILLMLYFNDGSEKLIETSFAGLKKLQEEFDENLSGYNSSYARRVTQFSK